jgi:hypothetical protein
LPNGGDTLNISDEPGRQPSTDRNSEFTTARQVLAVHTLFDAANANLDNKSAEVRLIEFLTGKNRDAIRTKLTEILERGNPSDKRSKKAVPRSPKSRREDLQFIKPFFERLGVSKIISAIDDEIKDIEQGDQNR